MIDDEYLRYVLWKNRFRMDHILNSIDFLCNIKDNVQGWRFGQLEKELKTLEGEAADAFEIVRRLSVMKSTPKDFRLEVPDFPPRLPDVDEGETKGEDR